MCRRHQEGQVSEKEVYGRKWTERDGNDNEQVGQNSVIGKTNEKTMKNESARVDSCVNPKRINSTLGGIRISI